MKRFAAVVFVVACLGVAWCEHAEREQREDDLLLEVDAADARMQRMEERLDQCECAE